MWDSTFLKPLTLDLEFHRFVVWKQYRGPLTQALFREFNAFCTDSHDTSYNDFWCPTRQLYKLQSFSVPDLTITQITLFLLCPTRNWYKLLYIWYIYIYIFVVLDSEIMQSRIVFVQDLKITQIAIVVLCPIRTL